MDINASVGQITQALNNIADRMQSNSVLTMVGTIISGVFVFVICEYLKEIWLSPLQEYKKLKQKISYTLTYYENIYCNVIDSANKNEKMISKYNAISDKIRDLASELRAFDEALSWLKVGIPSKGKIYKASSYLIGLSNSMFCPHNTNDTFDRNEENNNKANNIRKLLGISDGEKTNKVKKQAD